MTTHICKRQNVPGLVVLTVKKFFLMSNLNLLFCSFNSLALVLPSGATEGNSFPPSVRQLCHICESDLYLRIYGKLACIFHWFSICGFENPRTHLNPPNLTSAEIWLGPMGLLSPTEAISDLLLPLGLRMAFSAPPKVTSGFLDVPCTYVDTDVCHMTSSAPVGFSGSVLGTEPSQIMRGHCI